MRSAVLMIFLLWLVLLEGCVRVHIEMPMPKKELSPKSIPDLDRGKGLDPDELKEASPAVHERRGAALRPARAIPIQTREHCAADSHETRSVAQETGVWCWAASAQGVMSFHGMSNRQCEIVNKVKNADAKDGTEPFCCSNNNKYDSQCQKNGWPHQVFEKYRVDYRFIERALEKEEVKAQICRNGPFTYSIAYEEGGGHTFVVRDYTGDGETQPMFLFRDAHEYWTDSTGERYSKGFTEIEYDDYRDGWYADTWNTVDLTYVLIKPLPED